MTIRSLKPISCHIIVHYLLIVFLLALQIDLILDFEELLAFLDIRHRFVRKDSKENYPNVPRSLLPQWYDLFASYQVQTKLAKWYSTLWVMDEYSTSGVKIVDAIKPLPVGTSVVMFDPS